MRTKVSKVKDIKEEYWVVLRLMRLLSTEQSYTCKKDYTRTLSWLLDRFEFGALDEAISMLEKEERDMKQELSKP